MAVLQAVTIAVIAVIATLHAAAPELPPGRCPPRFRHPCPGGQPPLNGSCPCPTLNFTNAHGDGMVLQAAPQQAVVWGFCPPGVEVTVAFAGQQLLANVSMYLGRSTWSARLPPTASTFEPQDITASCCGNATATLSSVLFGHVWVCAGQSNMAYTMGGSNCWTNASATDPRTYDCTNNSGVENTIAERYNKSIRLYQQGTANMENHPPGGCAGRYTCGQGSHEPMAESSPACSDGIPACSGWGTTTGGVGSFSSVCWFFGRDLYESMPVKVPIGLIESDVGGTPIQVLRGLPLPRGAMLNPSALKPDCVPSTRIGRHLQRLKSALQSTLPRKREGSFLATTSPPCCGMPRSCPCYGQPSKEPFGIRAKIMLASTAGSTDALSPP